jgi:CheY-like chemotaxis protein
MNDRIDVPRQLPQDRRRILLVDDDFQLLSTLSAYLFHAGAWDVWQAPDCARARALWKELRGQIDVVIADVSVPDGNGIELLREFRQEKGHFFGLAISGLEKKSQQDGLFDAWLSKPFTRQQLLESLAER